MTSYIHQQREATAKTFSFFAAVLLLFHIAADFAENIVVMFYYYCNKDVRFSLAKSIFLLRASAAGGEGGQL